MTNSFCIHRVFFSNTSKQELNLTTYLDLIASGQLKTTAYLDLIANRQRKLRQLNQLLRKQEAC